MTETHLFSQESFETLKLLTSGRKSGLTHIAVLRFATYEGNYYVLAGSQHSDWALNAISSGEARIRLGDFMQKVKCEKFENLEKVRNLFVKKYGSRIVAEWYAQSSICLKLTPIGEAVVRGRIKGENESTVDFVSWKNTRIGYYNAVSDAFDSASEEYDFTIRQNFINVWIRDRSIKELLSLSKKEDVLLEIGCGTGAEAILISKHVAGIVATDISQSMISLLQKKVETRGLSGKVRAVRLGASEITRAADYLPNGNTRLAYSFNGALNCELRIEEFPRELSQVVERGGFFVCSIRNTLCLSEALAHAAVFQFDRMAPRKRQPIMVSVGGRDIPSYYYPPAKFAKFFEPYFTLKKLIGLPSILPPAYLSNSYVRARKILSFAERAEVALSGHYPLNRLGDQSLLVFQRSEERTCSGK